MGVWARFKQWIGARPTRGSWQRPHWEFLPLTQERFLRYIRPYMAEGTPGYAQTVEEYQQKYPGKTHISLFRGAPDREWQPNRTGSVEELTQFKGQMGRTIRPVDLQDRAPLN